MCFSPQADLVGGLVLAAIGVDALRHVNRRSAMVPLAALPLLLAAHQVVEAFAWWGLEGHVPDIVGQVAGWIYLLFAFVVLPVYVPVAVLVLEPRGWRRSLMAGFAVLGALVAAILLAAMVRGPVEFAAADRHVAYSIGLSAGGLIVAVYVLATCGSLMFSGNRILAVFGIVNLVAVAVLARLTIDGFASLWCAWAAVTAGVIALLLRADDSEPTVALALT